MVKVFALLYGIVAYIVFLIAFLYAIPFVGGFHLQLGSLQLAPKTVDDGGIAGGLNATALLINALLLCAFAIQHSVMARPGFKNAVCRLLPRSLERSTYVLVSSLLLLLLYWQWRPITESVWSVNGTAIGVALWTGFWLGWAVVFLSTWMINHFDLFGLRQVWLRFCDKDYTPLPFKLVGFYKLCRHPLMLGFIIAFWSAPTMTMGHLLFSVATTGYIFVALYFEERDLMAFHPDDYPKYRRSTSMILPFGTRKVE